MQQFESDAVLSQGGQELAADTIKIESFTLFIILFFGPRNRCGGDVGGKPGGDAVVEEGEAKILMDSSNGVFYDEAQVHNRDISIAVLRTSISKRKEEHAIMLSRKGSASEVPCDRPSDYLSDGDCQIQLDSSDYTKGNLREIQEIPASKVQELKAPMHMFAMPKLKYFLVRNLQALAASGLRSRRYALEIDGIGKIVALDYDEFYMLTHPKEFDAVDLDPYGSPSAFLDSAVRSIADGGLLMCTGTDLSVLCDMGNRYGSYPLKAKYHHEMALRMLLACVESHANRYRHYIVLVISVPMDFYMQVFVHIFTSVLRALCGDI
ncbi:unnamed protein product [Musa acuminata subsp. burmannicoides]